MIGYIYLITDTTNGKQYVGQHHYDKEELDSNYHGSGTIISKIYKKRPETLREEYLKTCYSQTELDEWEKYFIFTFNTLYPNGYNLQEGGNGGVPCEETCRKISKAQKGKHHSDETKKKMSNSQKGEKNHFFGKHHTEETKNTISIKNGGENSAWYGKKHSDETKRKISATQKGENNSFFGKHHTEETRKKISENLKGKHHSDETKRKISAAQKGEKNHMFGKHLSEETKRKLSKIVIQYTLDGEFVREWVSLSEIKRQLGYEISAISRCCKGKQKSSYGFIWKFKD